MRKYEKNLKKTAVHVIMGQGPDWAACRQTEKGTFTLNSNRPVSGAGSGIVAGPDRVRRGEEGETGGGG